MSEQREPLALKYRPGKFTDIIGQPATAAVLYRMVRMRTLPPAMLFWGTRGTGKTTSARIVAAGLNCHADPGPAEVWPCGTCPSCVATADLMSPDVLEIDAASNGNVAEVKRIREQVLYGTGGEYRVVILDEVHSMSGPAFESLLKILEEPPPNTVFILCTTEPGKVPKTIHSRCRGGKFPFRPISEAAIAEHLQEICQAEGIPADQGLLLSIAASSEGGMRDAIMQLDQVTSVGITSAGMWRELNGEDDFAPRVIGAAATGDYGTMFAALDAALYTSGDYSGITSQLVRCLRDMLTLTSGAPITATGEALAARQRLASQLGPSRLMAALRVLWDLQTKVRVENRREGLEIAVSMISDKLCPPADRGAAPVLAPVAVPLKAEELHSILG